MSVITLYHHIIEAIVRSCPAPDKFAHTYAGLCIWLAAAVVTRKSLGTWAPLAVVFVAEIGNEAMDWAYYGHLMVKDTLSDMAATWFWPVVIAAIFRMGLIRNQTDESDARGRHKT